MLLSNTPLTTSILHRIARVHRIHLEGASAGQKLLVYKETASEIAALLDQKYEYITENFIEKVLEPDIRDMKAGVNSLIRMKNHTKGLNEIHRYLMRAHIEISVALKLFDKKQEPKASTRWREIYAALERCRANLEKALDYF